MEDNEYQKEVKRILGSATFKLWRLDQGIARGTGPRVTSPGRRAMRTLLTSKQAITIHVTHKDGNRATRRAALKTARTKQRQASREYQGLAPVEIAIVKRRKAEQAARKAVRAVKVSR
jgi:hypothetical protein